MTGLRLCLTALLLSGCAAVNEPINAFHAAPRDGAVADIAWTGGPDDRNFVALAFSGGGTRASAFAYGMLNVLDEARAPDGRRLTEMVRIVSGVSGGSVTAAWFGLHGRAGLTGFRENYLLRDVESRLSLSPYNPVNLARAIGGGVNDRTTFARFLDEVLFKGARFGDLGGGAQIRTWINATDIANYTPFIFNQESFRALCSNLNEYPISEAVAASAGFPVAFSPMVLTAHGPRCEYSVPDWLATARSNQESSFGLKAYAASLTSYRDPDRIRYVKLLDGGITDNFGTTALSLARAASRTRHGPFTPEMAVRLRRGLVLVANAGRHVNHDWSKTLDGPGGVDLAMSIAESALETATRSSFDVLRISVDEWERDLIGWRCALSTQQVRRLGADPDDWDCADLKIFLGVVGFDALDADMRDAMNRVPTRLSLPADQVDLTIRAARRAMDRNPAYRGFLQSLRRLPDLSRGGAAGGLAAPERVKVRGGS